MTRPSASSPIRKPDPTSGLFRERVFDLVRSVPSGRVITYGAVARYLGDPRKAREVGWALHRCPDDVPAQRVVNRHGGVSGDSRFGPTEIRRCLLEDEGVEFGPAGCCDLERFGWEPAGDPNGR